MALESLHAIVRGRVQGVGFRYFVLNRARSHSLGGYTRNLADGSVEVYAEGGHDSLALFLEELRCGPQHAEVEDVEVTRGSAKEEMHGFHIR